MDAAHSFRVFLKNHMTPKSKGKTDITPVEKPTIGTIWVAKTFPPWQSIVLTTMKDLYNVRKIFGSQIYEKFSLTSFLLFSSNYLC